MQLNVSGHHVEVTESLRGYVASKIEKIEFEEGVKIILFHEIQRQKR